jgi:hypothetical protein
VLSDRGLCDGLITRAEESYRLRVCVLSVCDLDSSTTRRSRPESGCWATEKNDCFMKTKNKGLCRR